MTLRWLRLEAAREILEQTPLSVKEIIFKVGIKDKNHFRREFRRFYKMSPSVYRKMYRREGKGGDFAQITIPAYFLFLL